MSEQKPNFHYTQAHSATHKEPALNIYLNEFLVAEARGDSVDNMNVIPMRSLSSYEEDKLYEYVASLHSRDDYNERK